MHFCLDEDFKTNNFPEKFGNHLYFSGDTNLDYYSYESVYSLKYVIEGKEEYEVDGTYKHIRAGNFLLVNNNSPVVLLPSSSKAVSIFIEPSLFLDVLNNHEKTDVELLDGSELSNLEFNVFENVFQTDNQTISPILEVLKASHELAFQNRLQLLDYSFFFSIANAIIKDQCQNSSKLGRIKSRKNSTKQEILRRLLLARDYMHDNPEKSHSLGDLSEIAFMSAFHFHRNFKTVFGISPKQYSINLKLSLAKKELVISQISILDIAHKYGFADSSAFIRAFRNKFGNSPKRSISKN